MREKSAPQPSQKSTQRKSQHFKLGGVDTAGFSCYFIFVDRIQGPSGARVEQFVIQVNDDNHNDPYQRKGGILRNTGKSNRFSPRFKIKEKYPDDFGETNRHHGQIITFQ